MKKMGIDIGKARIGIALSDMLGILASCYETYHCVDYEQDLEHIISIIQSQNVDTVVVGLPLNMDGTAGEMTEYAKEFCENLKAKTNVKTVLIDERLSSYEAEEYLKQNKIKDWRERKKILDQVSACIILQNYLDKL